MPFHGISNDFRNNIGFQNYNMQIKPSFNAFSAKSMFSLENFVDDEELVEGEDYEIVRIEDSKTVEKPFKSAIEGFFKNKKDKTLDGEIGPTCQHATGDCWLLSGVNSMSYTEKGREILKNAIHPCDDGGVIVELKGANNYYISPKAINQASTSPYYSTGDLDMICLELAIEGARNDAANGNIVTPDGSPWYVPNETRSFSEEGHSAANGGLHDEAVYLITGKESESYHKPEDIETSLQRIEENGNKDIAVSFDIYEPRNVKDYDGNDIVLPGFHAYAVKSVKEDCVTITNPWNSGEEIKLNREVFTNNVCDWIRFTDLSDENEPNKYMLKVDSSTEKKDGYSIKTGRDQNGTIRRIDNIDDDGKVTEIKKYNEDGKITSLKMYGYLPDGSLRLKSDKTYDENENITKQNTSVFNTDETLERDSVKYYYDNGKIKESTRNEYEKGEIVEKTNLKYGEDENLTEKTVSSFNKGKVSVTNKSIYGEDLKLTQTIKKGYKDGELYELTTTDYNAKGQKTQSTEEIYNNKSKTVAHNKTEYYDVNGNVTHSETQIFDSEGNRIISVVKNYDKKGRLNMSTRNFDKDGSVKYMQNSYIDYKGEKVTEIDKNGDGIIDEIRHSKD